MSTKPYRKTAVAGRFYPGDAEELQTELASLFAEASLVKKVERPIAAVSPHAGIMYSGRVAASVFSAFDVPDNIILLAPNHTGLGKAASIINDGAWESILGDIEINKPLADLLMKNAGAPLEFDMSAHLSEHSIEVITPFLQYRNRNVKIVPIVLSFLTLDECLRLGEALNKTVSEYNGEVLVVASSDMTHYQTKKDCRQLDDMALAKLLALDPEGLYKTVRDNSISMCGVAPATVIASMTVGTPGATAALVDYDHSSRMTFDGDKGVSYAGVVIHED